MESAKSAVQNLLSKAGHHDTTVEEHVQPAVTEETIIPTKHEEVVEAVDREVHQDHYHTTVQPLQQQEVLPEKHVHNEVPVEEREFYHGNEEDTKAKLAAEAAKFKDTTTTQETQHTQSELPVATGEHVHHHVHETVQPVVNKETIVPEVVHTTIPIHEKHTAPSEHHGMSVLPEKSLNEFEQQGGSVTGASGTRHEEYEGDPRPYNPALQQEREAADLEPSQHDGVHTTGHTGLGTSDTSNVAGTSTQHVGMHEMESVGQSIPETSNASNVAGASGTETSALNEVDARGAPETGTGTAVDRSSQPQTGALGGTASLPSETTGNIANQGGLGSERNEAVGGASGAQMGALAGAGESSMVSDATHEGGAVQSDDLVGSVPGGVESSGTGTVEHFKDDPTQAGIGNESSSREYAGMGAGVAGVGAGAAAADLAQDHRTADNPGDLSRNDETMTTGASATGGTGTALGGTTDGNAQDFSDRAGTDTGLSEPQTSTTATETAATEPETSTIAADPPPKMSEPENVKDESPPKDDIQNSSQGRDPNTEGPDHPKMTGTGVPGSHSAFFGLTKDGKKYEETNSTTTAPQPAHSKESSDTAMGGGKPTDDGDHGSQAVTGGAVADQMHDPNVAEKGHGGSAVESSGDPGGKPGAGSGLTNASQGTGDVKPSEPGTGGEKASMMDKANPTTDTDGDGNAGVDD